MEINQKFDASVNLQSVRDAITAIQRKGLAVYISNDELVVANSVQMEHDMQHGVDYTKDTFAYAKIALKDIVAVK